MKLYVWAKAFLPLVVCTKAFKPTDNFSSVSRLWLSVLVQLNLPRNTSPWLLVLSVSNNQGTRASRKYGAIAKEHGTSELRVPVIRTNVLFSCLCSLQALQVGVFGVSGCLRLHIYSLSNCDLNMFIFGAILTSTGSLGSTPIFSTFYIVQLAHSPDNP